MTVAGFEDEVELAPGIYLTKRKPSAKEAQEELLKNTLSQMADNPVGHLEYLKDQIQRLEKAIEQLDYSNKEMHEADPTDPVYVEVDLMLISPSLRI
jgi:uncharacterized Fe-S cluster-containing protein